ncbi:glycosyl hydrolase family 95 catalytic domain-containing protein [Silvibacterium acidisoli]|uniref:glycosyl hydrolase family 95 catalytic domain-containing protein n=1 Tax=Acidobacteriaceae bacterium ZG23-2 TaxID=2883246 RepID=UPI00406C4388
MSSIAATARLRAAGGDTSAFEDKSARTSAYSDEAIRKAISASDLIYSAPAPRSEEGIPIGNGRMGSLVWTAPDRLCFQINRVDLYASNSESNSFFEAHNDYCGGCAFLDIVFGEEVFPASGFPQRLSIYDGVLTLQGNGVSIRIVPLMSLDAIAITIDRHAPLAGPISAVLRMLRYERKYAGVQTESLTEQHAVRVPHLSHAATSRLQADDRSILLTQEFREDNFCARSAVGVTVLGKAMKPRIFNDLEISLDAAEAQSTTFVVSSAATMHPEQEIAPLALDILNEVATQGSTKLEAESLAWWHQFWSRGHLELHSNDGVADFVQQNYHYYLYLMAATSRGKYPPKFNSMLWSTGADLRSWGAQHWYTNTSCYYGALPASGRFELMDPMFDMYSAMQDTCVDAAHQQWGSQGMYIPETVYFDGIEHLPDDIAAEMRELYLMRKPWDQRSAAFMNYAQTKHLYSSRWNWIASGHYEHGRYAFSERGSGPFGPTSHMFNISAKVAYAYWLRYEYTQDQTWLRERAYPMLRGAVEFYRNFPNLKKGDDGRYHIHWVNSGEPVFGARDTMEETSAMRAITPALLRAASILNLDTEMRPVWQEFFEHLPSMPVSDDPDAIHPASYSGSRIFVNALKPAVKADRTPNGWLPDMNSLSICYFDLCRIETADRKRFAVGEATIDLLLHSVSESKAPVGGLSVLPEAAASFGKADAVATLLPQQMQALPNPRSQSYRKGGAMANRMTYGEGPQGISAQHLGRAAAALQQALLQSCPPEPGGEPILHLFPAWPRGWEAQYTLYARGGFVVSAAVRAGKVSSLTIESRAGSHCRLRNPYSEAAVRLVRNGQQSEILQGSLLEFPTSAGERIVVQPGDSTLHG